ncbi:MAG: T9SS type A sorting domain-containing protein [Bacteroidales bacterium]
MKRLIFLLISINLVFSAVAQVKQEVIASAGGYNKSSDNTISISWTLGETIVPTYVSQDGSLILTHGFQQKLIITSIEENIEVPVTVTVYPNPTSELLNIKFEAPVDKLIQVQIMDGQGRIVINDRIEVSVIQKMINLEDLSPGVYFMRLVKGTLINVYKIVKL